MPLYQATIASPYATGTGAGADVGTNGGLNKTTSEVSIGDAAVSATQGFALQKNGTKKIAYAWAEGAAADVSGAGVDINAGDDYLGLFFSEKDSDTLQMYADTSGGYMLQLRDRGSNKGWAVSRDGTVNGRIEDSFQWDFYVPGAQTTGTDKAVYFQTPAKALIEEVRIHLGTAPTGSSFIVDVNDDGTTIFTTQANRPTVAISGTDATSGTPDGGTAVAKNSVLTIDVDQVGATIAGSDLVIFIRGRCIW